MSNCDSIPLSIPTKLTSENNSKNFSPVRDAAVEAPLGALAGPEPQVGPPQRHVVGPQPPDHVPHLWKRSLETQRVGRTVALGNELILVVLCGEC